LPSFISVLLIYSIINFPHYWVHRIAHEYRLPWLLLHRPHHYPNVMIDIGQYQCGGGFPVGFLVMFPYVLFFGAATKLFSAEPLYLEIIILNIVTQYWSSVSAHHSALYYLGFKYRLHRLHRLSDGYRPVPLPASCFASCLFKPQHQPDQHRMPVPFMLWDHVFRHVCETTGVATQNRFDRRPEAAPESLALVDGRSGATGL
jgi:hypothetical protein